MSNKITSKLPALKPRKIARAIVGHSVRFVISTAVQTLVPADSKVDKTRLFVGTYVISGMVSDKAEDYFDLQLDKIAGELQEMKILETDENEPDVPNP